MWRLVIDLSRLNTFLHVEKFKMNLQSPSGSIGRLPSHPHPPKLKEIPKVLPQVAGVPVHLPPIRTSQYLTLYRHLKRRLGRSLRSKFYKESVVRPGKKATHKRSRIEGGLPGPSKLQGPVP